MKRTAKPAKNAVAAATTAPASRSRRPLFPPQPEKAATILKDLEAEDSPLIIAGHRLTVLVELFDRGFDSTATSSPLDFAIHSAIKDVLNNVYAVERLIGEAHGALTGTPSLDELDKLAKGPQR